MSAVPRGNIVIQLTTFARLHVTGKPSTEYVSDETPMVSYMNLHLAFEQMRVKASMAARNSPSLDLAQDVPDGPPRVLVLGPENAGKTTACKILANYAVRTGQGWAPMLVNVDPGEVKMICSRLRAGSDDDLGRMDCSGNDLCLSDNIPYPDFVSRKSSGLNGNVSTYSIVIIGAVAHSILVRAS